MGYGMFSLWVIHKEGLCSSSENIKILIMMISTSCFNFNVNNNNILMRIFFHKTSKHIFKYYNKEVLLWDSVLNYFTIRIRFGQSRVVVKKSYPKNDMAPMTSVSTIRSCLVFAPRTQKWYTAVTPIPSHSSHPARVHVELNSTTGRLRFQTPQRLRYTLLGVKPWCYCQLWCFHTFY
jgi:hypothetical protein